MKKIYRRLLAKKVLLFMVTSSGEFKVKYLFIMSNISCYHFHFFFFYLDPKISFKLRYTFKKRLISRVSVA